MLRRRFRNETGAVLATVAFALPTLLLAASFVVETANWWVHKRHLQTTADAAALAGAAAYNIPCDDGPIRLKAQEYVDRNPQVGGTPTSRVHMVLNAPSFYSQTQPAESDMTNSACADSAVDVKMTETDVPWFFKAANLKFINARARVSIRKVSQLTGLAPVGVVDVRPKSVWIQLVDERAGQNNAAIGTKTKLHPVSTANGLAYWSNAGDTLPVLNPTQEQIGVRVILSATETNSTCGTQGVLCYDASSQTAGGGVGYIHGYDPAAVAANGIPTAREIELKPGDCASSWDPADTNAGWFSSKLADCTPVLWAKLDRPSGVATNANMRVAFGGTDTALTYDATDQYWKSATNGANAITLPQGSGPMPLKLIYKSTGNTPCKGGCDINNGAVRTWSADDDRSGPIHSLEVAENKNGTVTHPANSLTHCATATCSHAMIYTVGLSGSLALAQKSDPPVTMRIGGSASGSQNGAVDCGNGTFQNQLAQGCPNTSFQLNTRGNCTLPYPSPPDCVPVFTGDKEGQVVPGLNLRIFKSTKPPNTCPAAGTAGANNWSMYPNIPADDPRRMPVFVVPLGSFQGNGGSQAQDVQILDFAEFYITGWSGAKNGNPCAYPNGDDRLPTDNKGYIIGHFIKYIQLGGNSGDQPCDPTSITPCVAVLTK
jgi:hypothetical protein